MNKKKIFTRKKIDLKLQEEKLNVIPNVHIENEPMGASYTSITEDTGDEDDASNYMQNLPKISRITYEKIYQFLLSLLRGDKFSLNEALRLAKIMFQEGVRTPEMKHLITKVKKKGVQKYLGFEKIEKQSQRSK